MVLLKRDLFEVGAAVILVICFSVVLQLEGRLGGKERGDIIMQEPMDPRWMYSTFREGILLVHFSLFHVLFLHLETAP